MVQRRSIWRMWRVEGFDGFWEDGLSPWDIAAGALLITEARGKSHELQRRAAGHLQRTGPRQQRPHPRRDDARAQ